MLQPIRLYTDPILNKACKLVTDFADPTLEQLVQDLLDTCVANNGVGLAANQIGSNLQVCVLDVENRTKKMVLINPKIISYSKKKIKLNEACLSCPGLSVALKRPESVIIDANLLTGELVRYEFKDYDARILLHEHNHLFGVTIARAVQNYSLVL
jgi:peptide deformylase